MILKVGMRVYRAHIPHPLHGTVITTDSGIAVKRDDGQIEATAGWYEAITVSAKG